jgi:hypothetical protein
MRRTRPLQVWRFTHCGFLNHHESARTVSLPALFLLIVHLHNLTVIRTIPENHSDCLSVRNEGVSANVKPSWGRRFANPGSDRATTDTDGIGGSWSSQQRNPSITWLG